MKESLKRLHTVGFHPDVTTRTPIEVAGVWLKTMTMYAVRPTRDAFIKNQVVQGNHRPSKKLTRVSIGTDSSEKFDVLIKLGFAHIPREWQSAQGILQYS